MLHTIMAGGTSRSINAKRSNTINKITDKNKTVKKSTKDFFYFEC